MKKSLDMKSALIGVALGTTILVCVGAGGILEQAPPVAERFQLIHAGFENSHLYKIDTMTGQVWETSAESPRGEFLLPHVSID